MHSTIRSAIPLAVAVILATTACGGKAKFAGAGSSDLKAYTGAAESRAGEDVIVSMAMDSVGRYLLYAATRDPKEGWGFNHGLELYSFNQEINIRLPLGKLGRSEMFGFVTLSEAKRPEMIAVVKTVDTDGNGDVDERDANQLFVMAPDGLDEEPVSPNNGEHVVAMWGDPQGRLVYFATTEYWEGKRIPFGKKVEDVMGDGLVHAYAWEYESKALADLGKCEIFLGPSPDGGETACVPADGTKEAGKILIGFRSRDGKKKSKVVIEAETDSTIFPLGSGRVAYTKIEASSTGKRRTVWVLDPAGKPMRVTSASVDSRILKTLADGGLMFTSRATYSVADGTVLRALTGDASTVLDLMRLEGTEDPRFITTSGDGRRLAWVVFPERSFDALPKGRIMMAIGEGKAGSRKAVDVAGEKIDGLGEVIVDKIVKALGSGGPVRTEAVTADVKIRRVILPLAPGGEATDDALMKAALGIRDKVTPALAPDGYDGVVVLPGHDDAAAVFRWHPEFGRHLTYLVAYNYWLPVRDEYDLVIEDLVFRKLPGCADPRMVQMHCAGWMAAVRPVASGKMDLVCRATPLDPNMKVREGRKSIEGVVPGAEAVTFDAIADKVDPRRSHRSQFDLLVFSGGKQIPYYDAAWAEATQAWIALYRSLDGTLGMGSKLMPFAVGEETVSALAKWYPSTVVRQEQHLDMHLFLEPDKAPAADQVEAWNAIVTSIMGLLDGFENEHDLENALKGRISMYSGDSMVSEWWHKTDEELAIEGCENEDPLACYNLGMIMKAEGKNMAAQEAFYMGCDLGSPEACEAISGGAAAPAGGAGAGAPAPADDADDDTGPGGMEKKAALPPGAKAAALPQAQTLEKIDIQAAVKAHIGEIKFCFEKAATAGMQVSVKISIDGKGKVLDATVKHSSVKNADVDACIVAAVKRIPFPVTPDGLPMSFSYPFTYAPQ